MQFQLAPEKSFAENITQLGGNRLDHAIEKLAGLLRDKPSSRSHHTLPHLTKTIHGARKDLKHARALLRLARHGMNPHAFKHENICLRDAGRVLSATRDAQVLVEVFDRLDLSAHAGEGSGSLATKTPGRVRQRLTAEASATGRADRLLPAVKQAVSILEGVRTRLPSWGIEEGGWRPLSGGLEAVYRDGRRCMAAVAHDATNIGGAGNAIVWHEWRKHAKHLSYQTRLLRPLWPRVIKEVAGELDKLADLLGDDHDLTILHDRFSSQVPGGIGTAVQEADGSNSNGGDENSSGFWIEDPVEFTVLSGLITTRRATIQRQALEIGHRIYQEKPGAFVRRFGGYWKVWRKEHPGEVRMAAVKAGEGAAEKDEG